MVKRIDTANSFGEEDPFTITTEDFLGFCLLKDANLLPVPYRIKVTQLHDYRNNTSSLPGQSRHMANDAKRLQLRLKRLVMGLFSGLSLIGPMLIMVLHKDLLTALLTTSVSTVLFAFIIAIIAQDMQGESMLAAVAAYAAVLVVFIGTAS